MNQKDQKPPGRMNAHTPDCIMWLSKAMEMAKDQKWSTCRDFITNADFHARQAQLDEIADVCGVAKGQQ